MNKLTRQLFEALDGLYAVVVEREQGNNDLNDELTVAEQAMNAYQSALKAEPEGIAENEQQLLDWIDQQSDWREIQNDILKEKYGQQQH